MIQMQMQMENAEWNGADSTFNFRRLLTSRLKPGVVPHDFAKPQYRGAAGLRRDAVFFCSWRCAPADDSIHSRALLRTWSPGVSGATEIRAGWPDNACLLISAGAAAGLHLEEVAQRG